MINSELWNKIEAFDLDNPISEYGFSTRLAQKNEWPVNFTAGAITEYKKFMFLAATSEFMISPSEIVDVVWHQHLVFTQSYTDFCNILGRKIDHLPSTRNKEELEKFKNAKERTKQYYSEVFGEQPATYWAYVDQYGPLNLDKAQVKTRTFLLLAVFVWLAMLLPGYFILKPFYITITGPDFLLGYFVLVVSGFAFLELYNRQRLNATVEGWSKDAFVFNLAPMELVYLKNRNVDDVIHGYVSHMIDEGKVETGGRTKLSLLKKYSTKDPAEFVIAETISDCGDHGYKALLYLLKRKPAVTNVATAMDAFEKYMIRSRMFYRLFSLNFILLSFIFLLGAMRMITGIERERPVGFLFIMLAAFAGVSAFYLKRLSGLATGEILQDYYTQKLRREKPEDRDWDWKYFMLGTAVMAGSFMSMYNDATGSAGGGSGSDGSSGSGCGSGGCGGSCGGGCGGCGGG